LLIYLVFLASACVCWMEWEQTTRAAIFLPSAVIAVAGGLMSSYVMVGVQGHSTALFTGLLLFHATAAGLCLSERAGVPGLWSCRATPSRFRHCAIGAAVGVVLGVANLYIIASVPLPTLFHKVMPQDHPCLFNLTMCAQAGLVEEPLYRLFQRSLRGHRSRWLWWRRLFSSGSCLDMLSLLRRKVGWRWRWCTSTPAWFPPCWPMLTSFRSRSS